MKEIPFTFDDLKEIIHVSDFKMEVTEERFSTVAGELAEVPPTVLDNSPNPEYEIAEWGKVILTRRDAGKWRVQQIHVIYSRVMEFQNLEQCE